MHDARKKHISAEEESEVEVRRFIVWPDSDKTY